MTDKEIMEALRKRLSETPSAAHIIWENASGVYDAGQFKTPEPPFWVVSMVKAPPDRVGLGGPHITQGRLVVAVMAKLNAFTNTAEAQAEQIIAQFPYEAGQEKIPAGTGFIQVSAKPYFDEGFNDGAYWRVNTHVRWLAIQ